MSRNISTIYQEAVEQRNKYLELSEVTNDSKMSILNAFTWVTSALIYTYENILDVFVADIATTLNNRINGTPAYYTNALLKYQSGDELVVSDDGTKFGYALDDESKRIITKVSYQEYYSEIKQNNALILKVATGNSVALQQIESDELINVNAYINKIKFAGINVNVVSRKGDILVPKVTVYYDGAVSKDEVYTNIENALKNYIMNLGFDSVIYVTKIVDAIQSAEHVVDVYMNSSTTPAQGIYIAQYNDDNQLGALTKVDRSVITNSGYLVESSKKDIEADIPTWREAIVLTVES